MHKLVPPSCAGFVFLFFRTRTILAVLVRLSNPTPYHSAIIFSPIWFATFPSLIGSFITSPLWGLSKKNGPPLCHSRLKRNKLQKTKHNKQSLFFVLDHRNMNGKTKENVEPTIYWSQTWVFWQGKKEIISWRLERKWYLISTEFCESGLAVGYLLNS